MSAYPTGQGPSPRQALLTFRIIGGSMGLGVTLFALVSWFLHQQGGPEAAPGDPQLMFTLMLAVALLALVAAIVVWRVRVTPLLERPVDGDDWLRRAGEIQTNVIIVWALAEAPALFAEVVYFLYDYVLAGILGVVIIWVALAATWPKREWFGLG